MYRLTILQPDELNSLLPPPGGFAAGAEESKLTMCEFDSLGRTPTNHHLERTNWYGRIRSDYISVSISLRNTDW